MLHVSGDQRRARIAARHGIAPAARVASTLAATEAMVVLHATEPATVHLSCWARVDGLQVADVDAALYAERSVVKQLAMRRTVFVFPRDLIPAAWGSASARVAATERKRIAKEVVTAGITDDGAAWLERARRDVLAALEAAPQGLAAAEIRAAVPFVDVPVAPSSGSSWSISQLLTLLGVEASIMRGENAGHWRTSRPRWTLTRNWLPDAPAPLDPAAGYLELVRRWLRTFGPGTEADLVWWLGSTKAAVRAALGTLQAVEVSLDGGGRGWLLPDDLEPAPDFEAWTALLPCLDPTTMGWKERGLLFGPYEQPLFDRFGNAGTTALVDGRAVGCWTQDPDGVVELHLLEPVSGDARRSLQADADRLTAWLDGTRVGMVYKSHAMREALGS